MRACVCAHVLRIVSVDTIFVLYQYLSYAFTYLFCLSPADDTPVRTPTKPVVEVEEIPQYTAAEERGDARNWKMIDIGEGQDFRLDMRVIEPYKRVLSHGGQWLGWR